MLSELQQLGRSYEDIAVELLKKRGYHARCVDSFLSDTDIKVDFLDVEVKAARPTMRYVRRGYYREAWQFDVSRIPKDRDLLVMLCCVTSKDSLYWYLIPSWLVVSRQTIFITSHPEKYKGMWAKYREKWSMIDSVYNQRAIRLGQLKLDGVIDDIE